jgi:hypothetical protein
MMRETAPTDAFGSMLAGGRGGKTEILARMEVTMPGMDGLRFRIVKSVKMLLLPLALLTAHPCLCQGTDDQALVDQFFPQRLVDDFKEMWPDETPSRQSAFLAADLNGSGIPEFLIAVYSTNVSAAVRVLKKQGGSAVLVDEPKCNLHGLDPSISTIDLDHSGSPQFLVQLGAGQHGEQSQLVFKWNGTALKPFGPFVTEDDGTIFPVLFGGEFLDLDGDGILEAVSPLRTSPAALRAGEPQTHIVYKLVGGAYSESDLIFDFFFGFVGSEEFTFAVADPKFPHIMTIANGDGRGYPPVTAAEIRLNGVVVAGPDRINQQTKTLRIPVNVAAQNTLSVSMSGVSGAVLNVGIGPERAPTMAVTPESVTLSVSQTQQFAAAFTGTNNTTVTWDVELSPDASGVSPGYIDSSGLYTAPSEISGTYAVIVTATREADIANTASATVTLVPPIKVKVGASTAVPH